MIDDDVVSFVVPEANIEERKSSTTECPLYLVLGEIRLLASCNSETRRKLIQEHEQTLWITKISTHEGS